MPKRDELAELRKWVEGKKEWHATSCGACSDSLFRAFEEIEREIDRIRRARRRVKK